MAILSDKDRTFWDKNGYIVIHEAVPRGYINAALGVIWGFLNMSSDDRKSWYPTSPRRGIMVEMYQHQELWENRQYPRVYKAFTEILEMERLWVSIARVSMSPPEQTSLNKSALRQPIPLHWDYALQLHGDGKPSLMEGSLEYSIPFWVQGVLYLTDTPADGGAFTCIPGFHQNIEAWVNAVPQAIDPRKQAQDGGLFLNYDAWLEAFPSDFNSVKKDIIEKVARPVPAKAGDLIIWHSALPHGACFNTAMYPRVVQYMTMFPAQGNDEVVRNRRLKEWRKSSAGKGTKGSVVKPSLIKEIEDINDKPKNLSSLGRKLLGLDNWK